MATLGGLSDTNKDLRTGDRILIKYLKDKQDYPILVKNCPEPLRQRIPAAIKGSQLYRIRAPQPEGGIS